MTTPIFQLLTLSRLAPQASFSVVNEIASVSRRSNPAHGITGALLFDGEYFAQLLEGPEAEVTELMHKIAADPRHDTVTLLYGGATDLPRLTQTWRSGYCESQQLGAFAADETLRGPLALAVFASILQGADVE